MDPTSKSFAKNHGQKVMCEKICLSCHNFSKEIVEGCIKKHHGQIDNFLGGHENLTGENWDICTC